MLNIRLPLRAVLLVPMAIILGGAASCQPSMDASPAMEAETATCASPRDTDARLFLRTDLGDIAIDLYDAAAPQSVRTVKNLVCFGTADPASDAQAADRGYYDNLVFDYTHPNIEIRLSKGRLHDDIRIPKEINANALGLDEQIVETPGEAMDMFQFVIHKEFAKNKSAAANTPQLLEWVNEFRATNDPDFLIGKSRKDINEALGYSYMETLPSRPVERGSVMLQPASKTHSSARIVIALTQLKDYWGKWTVIGEVVDGLELADRIAKAPSSGRVHPRWQPLDPVVITKAEMVFDRTEQK